MNQYSDAEEKNQDNVARIKELESQLDLAYMRSFAFIFAMPPELQVGEIRKNLERIQQWRSMSEALDEALTVAWVSDYGTDYKKAIAILTEGRLREYLDPAISEEGRKIAENARKADLLDNFLSHSFTEVEGWKAKAELMDWCFKRGFDDDENEYLPFNVIAAHRAWHGEDDFLDYLKQYRLENL